MGYQVQFEFSPLYELINSLELFLFRKSMKNVELGTEWIKEVQGRAQVKNIDFGKGNEAPCFDYLYLLLWQSPQKQNVNGFIKWLRSLSPGDLYEKLFSYELESLPTDLSIIRDQYVQYIEKWDEVYFKEVDPNIIQTLEKSMIDWVKKQRDFDAVQLVEIVSGGLKIEPYHGLNQVILTPTYHPSPVINFHKFKNIFHIMYPVDLTSQDERKPSKKLMRITKALADENRVYILKILSEGPKTFTEILQKLDVSKSTVHHHVMTLRSAGLISVYHTSECCNELYIYRPIGITELNHTLTNYIAR